MCYWILPQSGITITRTMVQSITMEELATNEVKEQFQKFDNEIGRSLRPSPTKFDPG